MALIEVRSVNAKSKISIAIACLLWLVSIGLGLYFLMNYETTPGKPAAPPAKFPKDTKLKLSSDNDTLVMFVHPQCPCTKASLDQLARIPNKDHLRVKLVYIEPSVKPDGWSEKWQLDDWTKIPNVEVIKDMDGVQANIFNAKTSGQTFLFDSKGRLFFNGGITAARGVAGDNKGFDNLCLALSRNKDAEANDNKLKKSLVFGCNLLNERN
jgi:hypothetical protein